MYFTKIQKTKAQLEIMINVLTLEYGAKDDKKLAEFMCKYFDIDVQDASDSLKAYRAMSGEDYEQQSKKIEYAGL